MQSLFYRINTDRSEYPVALENTYAGGDASACWLMGGGPSFDEHAASVIAETPAPRMAINLAGAGLLRPTFWTSYDPSVRFHKSVYLDPGVMKFVHKRRALDLVPESSFKVCDCPNLLFFERERQRQFTDFVAPHHTGIVDWSDSMVQAIDILYRLGFRTIYLVGCEMQISPSSVQQHRAREVGVVHEPGELLKDFLKRCNEKGLTTGELEEVEREAQYHFAETKPLESAANADAHYFRVSQYLRLCRRAMSLAGLRLISVTPHSRLNDYFPVMSIDEAAAEIKQTTGDPALETTAGLYQQLTDRRGTFRSPMRDFRPPVKTVAEDHVHKKLKPPENHEFLIEEEGFEVAAHDRNEVRDRVRELREHPIEINEAG
ncbi:MAG: hypothetical protein CMJ46_04975 [Planctomyces sp.]|nr:hypothetical protein [Planctomyces sp.]